MLNFYYLTFCQFIWYNKTATNNKQAVNVQRSEFYVYRMRFCSVSI